MKVQLTNNRKRSALAFLVLVGLLLLVTPSSTFGDADEIYDKVLEVSDDDGNEATGQVAAWFLVAANLTVAISLLTKGITHFIPISAELKSSISRLNHYQKKHLMKFHYYVNPVILAIAAFHWLLSRCSSTSLPELGLLLMLALSAFGILLKFKIVPTSYRKTLFKVHTNAIAFASVVCILVLGHLMVD
jgi:hypothetical protein